MLNYGSTYHICMNLNMFVSNYMCLIMNVLIIFYVPKYVYVEIFVFNYGSTYHIYMGLNMLVSNYAYLMMNVLIIFVWTKIC
jgi:hypothetical protein